MPDWLQDFGPFVAIAAAIAAVWGLLKTAKEAQGLAATVEGLLEKHPPLRARIVRWLVMPSLFEGYRDWLGRELDRLDRWMGGYVSGKALLRCSALALAYPSALLLVTYGAGGPGAVGTTEFFPPLEGWRQPVVSFGLLIGIISAGLAFAFSDRIDAVLKSRIAGRLERRGVREPQRRANWLYRIVGGLITATLWLGVIFLVTGRLTAGAIAFGGLFAVAFAIASAAAITLALFMTVALAVGAGAFVGAAAPAIAVIVAVGGSVARSTAFAMVIGVATAQAYEYGVNEFSIAALLFFAIFPLTNAFLDWWSWAASRWLGRDLHDLMCGEERTLGAILKRLFVRATMPVAFFVHVALDLATAAAFLVGLAVLLPFVIELFNNGVEWFREPAPLDLKDYLAAAIANPWPDGAWALAMLFTTLVPTALHGVVALMTLFMWLIQPTEWRAAIAEGLEAEDEEIRSWAALKAAWLVMLTPLVAATVVVGVGYVLWKTVGLVFGSVAGWLHAVALWGINAADWLTVAVGMTAP